MRLVRRARRGRDASYRKSQRNTHVRFVISQDAKKLFAQLRNVRETSARQHVARRLLMVLSRDARIAPVHVTITDARQYHKRAHGRVALKRYGYYRPQSSYIYVHNRTAVRGQILAAKTFCDTLLHEWMHHYDTKKLRIDSRHTKGFYARLGDLKNKLGRPTEKIGRQ